MGCVLSRRQVMLVLNTDLECTVFDRFEVRLLRGTDPTVVWRRTYMRKDCPATGLSIPSSELARGDAAMGIAGSAYRLGIVDERRTDARLRIEVSVFRQDTAVPVLDTVAETDFVDGTIYSVPMDVTSFCLSPPMCPPSFVCRALPPDRNSAGCGSVYRQPGTLGTFTASAPLRIDDTAVLEGD